MENRIKTKFDELKLLNKKALITFLTSGDPNQKLSLKILKIFKEKKVDLIEIGFPFSDPMADGPTIQKSSQRAIKSGSNLYTTFKLIEAFRKDEKKIPIVLMGYFNPIFQFGLEPFFKECKKIGVDGLIIVDLPPEESNYIDKFTQRYEIFNIRLLTPTTGNLRLKKILKNTDGFLYYISVMGITGTKKPSINSVESSIKKIRKISSLPVCVGFGITNKNQIKNINKISDGCVVGSAIIKYIEEFFAGKYTEKKMLKGISEFLDKLQN